MNYDLIEHENGLPVKAWTRGVTFEDQARQQVLNIAKLPIIYKWVAVMPDVHAGIGATIGSVIPTVNAIIPAAVGVDIGCGMMAVQTSLKAKDLPDHLLGIRSTIEKAVPHGKSSFKKGGRDKGSWTHPPEDVLAAWSHLKGTFKELAERHPALEKSNHVVHLGTLGGGNHFVELCLDETDSVWIMLHSGSRGVGNRIGSYFIELAKKDMRSHLANLPDKDLAYFEEGSEHFADYVTAVEWAQEFAATNRRVMMDHVLASLRSSRQLPPFSAQLLAVNCHHNYVARETHYGSEVFVTRKGAVRAKKGELGIIPGSMGAQSFIVRGLGNAESFESCSHGAGRLMSRTAAKQKFTLEDHKQATLGVECREDSDVIDETPGAYKPIDQVMKAQKDLVEVVHTLKQIVCVKG